MPILFPSFVYSQENSKSTEKLPFARVVSSDEINNYFSLDLEQLPGFFERAYLLDLIFADSKLVISDSRISGTSLEVFSNKINDKKLVLESLETYLEKALHAGKTSSPSQKEELMKKFDKYR